MALVLNKILIFFFFLLVFWEKVLLCGLGWPSTFKMFLFIFCVQVICVCYVVVYLHSYLIFKNYYILIYLVFMYDCVGVSMSQSMRGYQTTIAGVHFLLPPCRPRWWLARSSTEPSYLPSSLLLRQGLSSNLTLTSFEGSFWFCPFSAGDMGGHCHI